MSPSVVGRRLRLAPYAITLVGTALRCGQFLCAIVALSTIAAAFTTNELDNGPQTGESYRLGSHEAALALLAAYSLLVYSGWHLAAVEIFRLVPRPSAAVSRPVDTVLALLLLAAGIALALSDYVRHCDAYDSMLNCDNLAAATVFTFVAILPLFGSVALSMIVEPSLAMEFTGDSGLSAPISAVGDMVPTSCGPAVLSPQTEPWHLLEEQSPLSTKV